jgi:hypothetical protein
MRDPDRSPLHAAWRALAAPPPFRALADEDDLTRASVDWLRATFLRATPSDAPLVLPRLRRQRRLTLLLPLAAAATLLLAVGLQQGSGPSAPPAPTLADPSAALAASSVEVLVSQPNRLELRSGVVRLTLLHTAPKPL